MTEATLPVKPRGPSVALSPPPHTMRIQVLRVAAYDALQRASSEAEAAGHPHRWVDYLTRSERQTLDSAARGGAE